MITSAGKNIIGKYLLGQAPAYGSYIAVGCGSKPLAPYVSGTKPDYSAKTELDFEMFRVPVSSRGFVDEDGVSKIVLTAELPTEERYEISEVGLYSAGVNPSAGSSDSKNFYAFASNENWKKNGSSSIITISEQLDNPLVPNVIKDSFTVDGVATALDIFQTNADNTTLTNDTRVNRNERPRFLNSTILMRSNSSTFTGSEGALVGSGNFIQLSSTAVDLSKNSPLDEIKLAFSLLNKDGTAADITDKVKVRILVEFLSSNDTTHYARMESIVSHSLSSSQNNFNTNRYFVSTKKIQDLNITNGFPWKSVDTVKVYAQVLTGASTPDTITDTYYIALDAMRIENKTISNPVYGLTGYSVIRNTGSLPIVKNPNTTSYIEFRFIMDVL